MTDGFTHKRNLWWHEARIPWRWHRCRPWTQGNYESSSTHAYIERCACGAIRIDHGSWLDRNARRSAAKDAR